MINLSKSNAISISIPVSIVTQVLSYCDLFTIVESLRGNKANSYSSTKSYIHFNMPADYYEILEVPKTATPADIKKA